MKKIYMYLMIWLVINILIVVISCTYATVPKPVVFDCTTGAPAHTRGLWVKRESDNQTIRMNICSAAESDLFLMDNK